MLNLAMFVPLAKADAAQRLVYGSIDETPDRAGEVMDYATARPAFQAWSEGMHKASGGKSFGNVRAQHDLTKAAGKLTEITFDDDAKRISFIAHIVDDQEWQKVEQGVYTGFSPGGSYAKRWQDGAYRRYTPKVGELSIVDVPCIPSGCFTMTKADGTEVEVEFVMAKAYEPGNDATKARADDLAKAAGADAKSKDFVVQARAELISENATAELAKMAAAEPEPVADIVPTAADTIADALAKADAALAGSVVIADADSPFADLAKAADALGLIGGDMGKSLWSVEWLNNLLRDFACLQSEITWDAKFAGTGVDGEDMTIPAQAAKIVQAIGALLVKMTQEGVADLLTGIEASGIELVIVEGDNMALAASIVDLVKADTALMEKAGARNSKADGKTIQSMHDGAVALGAACDAAVAKADGLAVENERLEKAVGDSLPRLTALVDRVAVLTADNADLNDKLAKALDAPAPPKGAVFEVSKEDDTLGKAAVAVAEDDAALPLLERARRASLRLS